MPAGKVIVQSSPINGMGVFAAQDIRRGDSVVRWNNTRELSPAEYAALPPSEHQYIDVQDGKTMLFGIPERYINHSCEPNTTSRDGGDIALRDIKATEEITTDFSNFFIPGGSFKCACGSPSCRGVVTGRPAAEKKGTIGRPAP